MRVLYMSHRYHTNQNTIMKGWKENGHKICFISQYAGKIEDYTYVKPIVMGYSAIFRIIDYIYVHVLFKNRPNAMDMKLKCGIPPIIKLAKCIRQFHPDIAIIRERSIYTICMNAVCRMLGVPTILYNLSPVWEEEKKKDIAHKLVWKLTPKYRMSPSPLIGVDYNGKTKDPYGFVAPFLMESKVSPEEKKYFKDGRINIFSIGKYQERKQHWMMVHAIEKLSKVYDIHLNIAGELSNEFHQEYFDKVVEYINSHGLSDKITLYKNLNKEEVSNLYNEADLYIIPSTGEPASITVIEAMAFSVPAISGSDNGTASYIEEGVTGYVFEDKNQQDLEEKIEKVISNKDNLVKMGRAGYQSVLDNFQFKNYFQVVEEIISLQKEERK